MLVSNGTVNSMILITLASGYWMKRSGRDDVTRTSGGMVSPLSDLPGKSLMMLALFVRLRIYVSRWFRMQLCLHVYRPCSNMVLHPAST